MHNSFTITLRVGGWVGLGGWLHNKTIYLQTVTYPSISGAWHRVTWLICTKPLALCQIATSHQTSVQERKTLIIDKQVLYDNLCRDVCRLLVTMLLVDAVGTAALFHVHVLLWTAECDFTQLCLDINPARHRWLWHWRSATVVSVQLNDRASHAS